MKPCSYRAAGARLAALALVAAVASPALAGAQVWRSLRIERTVADTAVLDVDIRFGEGVFELRPGTLAPEYSMQLRYDAARTRPRHVYDAAAGTLSLGSTKTAGKLRLGSDDMGEARIELPREVPLRLSMEIAAASSALELGGISLSRLSFTTGASQLRMRFSEPNLIPLEELSIDGSAAFIRASELANSRASSMDIQSHLGSLELDFGGEWHSDISATLRVVLATAVIRVPRDVGVEIQLSRTLSSFAQEGFVRDGDTYRSMNWLDSPKKLRIRATSTLSRLRVVRSAM